MNNEPVAHFYPEGEGCTVYDIQFAWKVTGTTEPIPLYTHPAKTLTDEEIAEIIQHLENAKYVGASKAADMLRQQQSEIEALKSECKRLSEWLVKVGEKK
jgi:hypothetical protein